MAAIGPCAPVRDPLTGIAVVVMVNTARVRDALSALARLTLSPHEWDLFTRAVTVKRKTELVAGRVAAKIACAAAREQRSIAFTPVRLDEIDIRREPSGAPLCVWPDGTTQYLSITHAASYAVALAAFDGAACGVDIEPASRSMDLALDGLFHPIERLQIQRPEHARRCWTVREAWGKLTSRGVAADFERVASIRAAGASWIAVPPQATGPVIVAAGANRAISIAMAIRSDGIRDAHYIAARERRHGKDDPGQASVRREDV